MAKIETLREALGRSLEYQHHELIALQARVEEKASHVLSLRALLEHHPEPTPKKSTLTQDKSGAHDWVCGNCGDKFLWSEVWANHLDKLSMPRCPNCEVEE